MDYAKTLSQSSQSRQQGSKSMNQRSLPTLKLSNRAPSILKNEGIFSEHGKGRSDCAYILKKNTSGFFK